MHAESKKQYNFMKSKSKSSSGVGPSSEVAEEFIKKTPKKKRSMFMKKDKK